LAADRLDFGKVGVDLLIEALSRFGHVHDLAHELDDRRLGAAMLKDLRRFTKAPVLAIIVSRNGHGD
jgi:hypothetical protein